ncbi:GNAT family N-acetyltransferase [Colwellia sp. D2M02]|uniref:GNAT family N-acetyltransferase n=1 Tax=Colwellia sp. D2M02 TaxID=2841562 RepID=UPI001C07F30F|nr:GNAT family N-acetyltransferase [Colwellia sp. D2M02]MBU2892947.1 GNAT family N-acetyltransferase [Colwellia sp. D2M02]
MNINIKTKRFTLRTLQSDDASLTYLSWLQDDESSQYIMNIKSNLTELAGFIEQRRQDINCIFLGIFSDEKHIGNIKYQRMADYPSVATMGILIGEKNWRGKGVAGEVITASIGYLKESFNVSEVNLGVEVNNIAAIKAYEKIGFDRVTDGYYNFDNNSIEMSITL